MKKLMFVLAIGCLLMAGAANAGIVTVPTGLINGDKYRLIFVTTETTDALSSSLSTYDTIVANAVAATPALSALGTTWGSITCVALSNDPRIRFAMYPGVDPDVPIYNLGDQLVASTYGQWWSAGVIDLNNPVTYMENGNAAPGGFDIWTGTQEDGTNMGDLYLGDTADVIIGASDRTGNEWIWHGNDNPAQFRHLFAISGVITVGEGGPVVAEPSALALLGLGFLGIARRRR